MICKVMHIEQPCSGEYDEKIYDIESTWNSSDWTWIKFEENNCVWCGEFRGKYRGAVVSEKLEIIVILTSDYMYVLDLESKEVIEYLQQPSYVEITCTPINDILLSDGYGLEIFKGRKISSIDTIVLPIHADCLKFGEYDGNILKMTCEEFCNWSNNVTLFLDCYSLEVVNRIDTSRQKY